ncbi:hypothetical protein HPB50_026580 [Hyalomma asiaticum]|uniref:Uncharacterized protein n=1 Tax=Hyalomma asiaticum TaxID=266040 RepID=A0ACB7TRZ6_HYAAI|nr:hypothetical protein HPB50_026580 [Hyalomma asiaticum]
MKFAKQTVAANASIPFLETNSEYTARPRRMRAPSVGGSASGAEQEVREQEPSSCRQAPVASPAAPPSTACSLPAIGCPFGWRKPKTTPEDE